MIAAAFSPIGTATTGIPTAGTTWVPRWRPNTPAAPLPTAAGSAPRAPAKPMAAARTAVMGAAPARPRSVQRASPAEAAPAATAAPAAAIELAPAPAPAE
jgi:hypothetical protein